MKYIIFVVCSLLLVTNCLAQANGGLYDSYKQSNSQYISQYSGSIAKEVGDFVQKTKSNEIARLNMSSSIYVKVLEGHYQSLIEKNNALENVALRDSVGMDFNVKMLGMFEKIDELGVVLDREYTVEIMKLMTETYNTTFARHLDNYVKTVK